MVGESSSHFWAGNRESFVKALKSDDTMKTSEKSCREQQKRFTQSCLKGNAGTYHTTFERQINKSGHYLALDNISRNYLPTSGIFFQA